MKAGGGEGGGQFIQSMAGGDGAGAAPGLAWPLGRGGRTPPPRVYV